MTTIDIREPRTTWNTRWGHADGGPRAIFVGDGRPARGARIYPASAPENGIRAKLGIDATVPFAEKGALSARCEFRSGGDRITRRRCQPIRT